MRRLLRRRRTDQEILAALNTMNAYLHDIHEELREIRKGQESDRDLNA